ncbi:hypothetical protein V5O48_002193 [Marasmius crinis-equi]|uniref:HIT domain-containing protein n=1 Tax=Marasmius crinis-equi TaxID=585013 RepID=A0ABR3FWC9_9AGAR
MDFSPKPGCPLCSIVFEAGQTNVDTDPVQNTPATKILWRDETLTAYLEQVHPVSSQGHIIIALNLHVPSIYTLSSTDLPLLVNIRNIANRLLASLDTGEPTPTSQFHVGFINPPFKDTKIPVTDHLHCHAYIGSANLTGWWRGISYSSVAWYPVDDLIAEIRESVSNNRVKSGYTNRTAPIDNVPQAGARSGTADGRETTMPAVLPDHDVEVGV